jgi:hypothetical protein
MPTYLRCDGTVSDALILNTAKQCSTGWVQVDEPVYTLMSQTQASDLIIAVVLLVALWATFKIILHTMGIKL